MIRLRTIGQVAVQVGDRPVPASNELIIAAILYLVAERGKRISRRTFAELFFASPDPDAAFHSGRQLVYRLRKERGVPVDGDQATIVLTDNPEWDVEQLLDRQAPSDAELDALRRGYLADFTYGQTEAFSRWLDEHRTDVTRKLVALLVGLIQAARSRRDYRNAGKFASACLGLDPLNEAATLATAESLVAIGAKADAIDFLNRYLEEVGPRSDLRIAPRLLRERIAEYVIEPDRDQTALIGRAAELETLRTILDESTEGRPQICLVSGQGGIGKTRLVDEVCSIAALGGHAIAHVRLTPPDVDRPFAILRDLGPTLLELPGALGAAPEALAAMRGLCGRGPNQYSRRPANAYDARAVAADIQRKAVDMVSAVAEEQPLVIRIENADHIDEASLELIEGLMESGKRLCVYLASRTPVKLTEDITLQLAISRVHLSPLTTDDSYSLLKELFRLNGRAYSDVFAENAVRISAGVPLFLRLLYKNFLVTGDPTGLPPTLSDSLMARLDRLEEPAKSVFDVIVTLGSLSTVQRVERVTGLPMFTLTQALRTLEEQGFVRSADGALLASHDLLADAARRRMPMSVNQFLHRSIASILEALKPEVDPLEIAIHWQASGENVRAIAVLVNSARSVVALGRPRQAIVLLQRATAWATSAADKNTIDTSLLEACHAAGEDHLAFAAAERIDGFSSNAAPDVQVMAIEMAVGAGKRLVQFRSNLETIAANRSLDPSLRCRAGRLLLMIADDTGDRIAAEAALASIADIQLCSPEAMIPRLIFEVVFGSIDKVNNLVDQLLQSAKATAAPGVALQGMWTAAYALWRCGNAEKAAIIANDGYEVAKRNAVWSACIAFGTMIGNRAWRAGDIEEAQIWFDQTADLMNRAGGPGRGYQHYELGISLALNRGDPSSASRLLDEALGLFPGVVQGRFKSVYLSYRVTIDMASGKAPSANDVQDLIDLHRERRSLGHQDFTAEATIACLRRLGRFDEARQLREEYLACFRRERTPVSPFFKNLTQ